MNLTVSYGQIGNDTITCYTNSELKLIATKVIRANECDSLLILSEAEITLKDSVINNLNGQLLVKDSVITIYEDIMNDNVSIQQLQREQIDALKSDVVKLSKKNKRLKIGWASTVLVAAAIVTGKHCHSLYLHR